jgi:hypothetical protein
MIRDTDPCPEVVTHLSLVSFERSQPSVGLSSPRSSLSQRETGCHGPSSPLTCLSGIKDWILIFNFPSPPPPSSAPGDVRVEYLSRVVVVVVVVVVVAAAVDSFSRTVGLSAQRMKQTNNLYSALFLFDDPEFQPHPSIIAKALREWGGVLGVLLLCVVVVV